MTDDRIEQLQAELDRLRKRASDLESQLQQSQTELRFSRIVEGADVGLWEWPDITKDAAWCSPKVYEMLGVSPESETLGLRFYMSHMHPDDRKGFEERLSELQKQPGSFERSVRLLTSSNGYRWFEFRGRTFFNESGCAVSMAGSLIDITESKQLELDLVKQKELLELSQRIGHIGSWERDVKSGEAYWSSELYDLYGRDPEDGPPSFDEFIEQVHPLDRDRLLKAINESESGQRYEIEYRLNRHDDGQERWFFGEGETKKNNDGELVFANGISIDITDERKARQENQFKSQLIETSLTGIDVVDSKGRFVYANREYLRMWGYDSLDELIGTSPVGHCVDPSMPKTIIKTLKENKSSTFEFAAKRKDETTFDVLMSAHLFVDENGDELYVGSSLDISDRKQYERRLRASEARFRELFENMSEGVAVYEAIEDGADFLFKDINPAGAAIGISKREDHIGRRLTEVYPGAIDMGMLEALQTVWSTGRPLHYPARVYTDERLSLWTKNYIFKLPSGDVVAVYDDITQEKQMEIALRESEEQLRRLLDSMPTVSVQGYAPDGTVTYWNRASEEIYGYSAGEAMGGSLFELIIPTPMREDVKRFVKRAFETGEMPPTEELWLQRKGGGLVPVLSSHAMIGGADGEQTMFCIDVDLRKIKQAETALRLSEERHRNIAENFPDGAIFLFDRDHRYLFCAGRALEEVGLSVEKVVGKRPEDLFPPETCAEINASHDKVFNGEACTFYSSFAGRHYESLSFPILREDGTIDEGAVIVRDISERLKAEEERKALEQQILQTQKLESLGVLAGGIAHDFNNILMAILGHADIARFEMPYGSSARSSLDEIVNASRRAADLCRQMLAYSGKGNFIIESIDLGVIIEDMVQLLKTSINKKALLNLNLEKNLPTIRGDATQMRQIVMNLVVNASEAIGDLSGVITISTGAMECDKAYLKETYLDADLTPGLYVYLEVSDTGCGMDEETKARLFEPFFTTKFTGRGLGMSAALGIVKGHKGALKVYSELNKGTTFKLLFPVSDSGARAKAKTEDAASDWSGDGAILLADDEETIRALGKQMLERIGYSVVTAADGREAVEAFENDPGSFKAVILDLTMPHMGGEEAFREVRRIDRDAIVILTSGYAESEIVNRFSGKGLSGFIQKPFNLSTLTKKLNELLS